MARFRVLVVVLFALLSALSLAAQPRPLAITGVNVVDVVNGRILPDSTVTIRGGTIAGITPAGASPAEAEVVDGRGKFLIPGLWDMHAHNQGSGVESLDLFLANGVVGVRDMGSDLEFILPLRDRIRRGELSGPEIVAAGPILDDAPEDAPFRRRVSSAQEAREALNTLKARGVDFIKVHNMTPREVFYVVAEEAPKLGLPFAGHIPLEVTMAEAAASGITSIEHLSELRIFRECAGDVQPYDAERCRPLFDKLAAGRIWHTPTLIMHRMLPDTFDGKPMPHAEYASDSTLKLQEMMVTSIRGAAVNETLMALIRSLSKTSLTVIRDMLPRGNLFLAGCDGAVPGFCLHDEMEALTEAGLSPLQALQTATLNPAKLLKRELTEGSLEPGKRANLVLLDANPLEDIRNIRRIAAVVVRGRMLSKVEIDRMLAARRRE